MNRKTSVSSLTVVTAALFLGGCSFPGGDNPSVPAAQTPAGNTSSQAPSEGTSQAVGIRNFSFDPATVTVKKGTTVTWTNRDSAPHQIKSVSFNSDQLGNGQSFSFTFDEAGTFDYSCAIHPSMLGRIIVQ